jgi:hypothetical protein
MRARHAGADEGGPSTGDPWIGRTPTLPDQEVGPGRIVRVQGQSGQARSAHVRDGVKTASPSSPRIDVNLAGEAVAVKMRPSGVKVNPAGKFSPVATVTAVIVWACAGLAAVPPTSASATATVAAAASMADPWSPSQVRVRAPRTGPRVPRRAWESRGSNGSDADSSYGNQLSPRAAQGGWPSRRVRAEPRCDRIEVSMAHGIRAAGRYRWQ